MTSFKHSDTQIGIVKEWRRNLGWLAIAEIEESKYGKKAKIVSFINTAPASEEDKERNYRKKSNNQIGEIPRDYSGLIVSSSQMEGTRCERWYWVIKEGLIVGNGETIEEALNN
jgi:hypothetical protein